jgi:hypothetical protein
MSDEPTNPAQNAAPPGENPHTAVPGKPSLAARLLTVIRTLVDIGQKRLAAIRDQKLSTGEVHDTGHAFGTFNLSVIVARLLRGLRLADALERRVIASAARIDGPKRSPRPYVQRVSRPPRKPKPSEAEDNAALLARMPTEQEIAAMVRRRPIALILGDICADLGIGPGHPHWQQAWRELRSAMAAYPGQVQRHFKRAMRRAANAYQEVVEGLAPNWTFYSMSEQISGAGPPPTQAAI